MANAGKSSTCFCPSRGVSAHALGKEAVRLTWLSFMRLRDSSRWLMMTRRCETKADQSAVASLSLTSRNIDRWRGGCDCPAPCPRRGSQHEFEHDIPKAV